MLYIICDNILIQRATNYCGYIAHRMCLSTSHVSVKGQNQLMTMGLGAIMEPGEVTWLTLRNHPHQANSLAKYIPHISLQCQVLIKDVWAGKIPLQHRGICSDTTHFGMGVFAATQHFNIMFRHSLRELQTQYSGMLCHNCKVQWRLSVMKLYCRLARSYQYERASLQIIVFVKPIGQCCVNIR